MMSKINENNSSNTESYKDFSEVNNSDSAMEHKKRICLVGSLSQDSEVTNAAVKLNLPVITDESGLKFVSDAEFCTYFIVDDFDSEAFAHLNELNSRIFGKPAFLEMCKEGALIKYKERPVYCLVMKNCAIALTGYRKKNDCAKMLKLIHCMGGSVRKDVGDTTHVVAQMSSGLKYQYAVTFNIPVMSEEWVTAAWAHRDELGIRAEDENLMRYKLKMFYNLRIILYGFSEEDESQIQELIRENEGIVTNFDDLNATHVVVDDQNVHERPINCPLRAVTVKAEWFWSSIQTNFCANEITYLFEAANTSIICSPHGTNSPSAGTRSKRRKRLRETVQQLAGSYSPAAQTLPACKRRSSVTDLTSYISAEENSFLEASTSLLSSTAACATDTPLSPPTLDLKQMTPLQRVFHELVKTECNYVAVLETIFKVIKEPLEDENQPGGPMLDAQEIKYIFGNLPPIYDVHSRLRDDFLRLSHKWSWSPQIGKIILSHMADIEKAYPPFVNYFENVKETIQKISRERPRFHAFLKIAQNKTECGRQNLQELLIRPVQRLPSMSLLINDILKHTEKCSTDHHDIEKALDQIRSVMTFINDDKRKTEAKLKLFEIHNDIENCPPNLVASHRNYVSKVDATELSDVCSGRGDALSLFLFNDILEICKRKSKYNSLKSPSRVNVNVKLKMYKHLEMLPLVHIKRVVDITETEDCKNVFALIVRSNQELKERLYSFTICSSQETSKSTFLRVLCCNMANVVSRSDVENFVVSMNPQHLEIASSEISTTNALGKALRFAARTGRKVTRAFSFSNKSSPSKLRRAVSTVISPFANGSNTSQLRNTASFMNLAVNDLTLSSTPPCNGDSLMPAPTTTPTPRRTRFQSRFKI